MKSGKLHHSLRWVIGVGWILRGIGEVRGIATAECGEPQEYEDMIFKTKANRIDSRVG